MKNDDFPFSKIPPELVSRFWTFLNECAGREISQPDIVGVAMETKEGFEKRREMCWGARGFTENEHIEKQQREKERGWLWAGGAGMMEGTYLLVVDGSNNRACFWDIFSAILEIHKVEAWLQKGGVQIEKTRARYA
jgi:hypothetical protein